MTKLADKKVVFVLAPKLFRDEEYFQSKVILQAQGVHIETIAIGDPEEITGTQGGKARTDAAFSQVKAVDYDAIVFIGGEGCRSYFTNKKVHRLVQDFVDNKKIVGAICSAAGILAGAQVLKGKKITSFKDEKEIVEKAGAKWVDKPVVVDGTLITASDVMVAIKFGEAIVKALE